MRTFQFHSRLWIPRSRGEVFEFFARAQNLEEITPPWLQFHFVSTPPGPLRQGAEIEYRLKIHGIPVRWRTRIAIWDPPRGFVDEQVRGPYRLWIHEHKFSEDSGGTVCDDHVKYAPPGGMLVNRLFVERDIGKIFAYRSERLRAIFGPGPAGTDDAPPARGPGMPRQP